MSKTIKLKCENCGANLEFDSENFQTYCQYCGSKLLVEIDKINEVLKEKEITKQVTKKEEQLTQRDQLKYEHKEKAKKQEFKEFLIVEGGLTGLIALGLLYVEISEYSHALVGLIAGLVIGVALGIFIDKKFLKK